MKRVYLTTKLLSELKADKAAFFLRDSKLVGFSVKVNPTGQIKYLVEVRQDGRTIRKTIGDINTLSVNNARVKAMELIADIRAGKGEKQTKDINLKVLLERYTSGGRLKARTIRDYREAITFYLQDWIDQPIQSITKNKVECRYFQIRDHGVHGGRPTYSQAAKTMRILSALLNYAIADDLIEHNPVDVLKYKRIARSTTKRTEYLRTNEAREVLDLVSSDSHPMVLAIRLMLHTGLRKNEALLLKWRDLERLNDIACLRFDDTKNRRTHFLPITSKIKSILEQAENDTEYVFPSTQKSDSPIQDTRSTIRKITKKSGIDFKCHDLRRTFATRAAEVGIDHMMIKRLLNHKSNDITAQYIQWHSKDNLLAMKTALEAVTY
jgi:integrase